MSLARFWMRRARCPSRLPDVGRPRAWGTLLAVGLLLALAACDSGAASPTANPTSTPGPQPSADEGARREITHLADLAEQARGRASETAPNAALRQIDVGAAGDRAFRFTDIAATEEITVIVPEPGIFPDRWDVRRGISPLVGSSGPGLDLAALRVSPSEVARSAQAYWPGCTAPTMTLYGQGSDLSWIVFCEVPAGVASGTVDNSTGLFQPSPAPPARRPPTATPQPSPTVAPSSTSLPSPTATAAPTSTPTPRPLPMVTIGAVSIPVEVKITPQQKAQGLSGRDSLPRGTGMIFLYDEDARYSFWMKDMLFPLDFVWIGGDCTVAEVTANVPPPMGTPANQLTIYQPSRPVRDVLEINAGEAASLGIVPGAPIRFVGDAFQGQPCLR